MNRFRATAVAVLWALAVTANVHASDGRITFSGAVVVSTCSPTRISGPPARPATQKAHSECPGELSPAAYTLRVEPAASHSNSNLVTYYANYVRAAGGGDSVWVATQIYD
ncbi:MAG TPA: hypothetical protein VIT90_16405 [Lysobacter sp.]